MFDNWNELEQECLNCKKCELCQTRNNVVFGVGNKNAEVLFIGEGPGENEDLQGEPFVGRGGKLLDKMLYSVDLSREENIYIANIVKYDINDVANETFPIPSACNILETYGFVNKGSI